MVAISRYCGKPYSTSVRAPIIVKLVRSLILYKVKPAYEEQLQPMISLSKMDEAYM